MTEGFERQSNQHATDGSSEPHACAAAVCRRRRAVGAEVGRALDGVTGCHCTGQVGRHRPVADGARGWGRPAGGSGRHLLQIHNDWLE